MNSTPAHNSIASSSGSIHEFPEEDLRSAGRENRGYFPARLGQLLSDGKYLIVRKLGWGQYSSVWLAKDCEDRFVALKILTVEASQAIIPGPNQKADEKGILEKIATADPEHAGFRYSLAFYDSFDFKGPHGTHTCIVTEALGFSLNYIRHHAVSDELRLPTSIVKHVVKQALLGLEYLHDVCGVVHADIKHDNILFRPRDLKAIVARALVEDPSRTYDYTTEATSPVIPIASQPLGVSLEEVIDTQSLEVVLADVGHSQWKSHHFQELIQPRALRAPEVILGYPWDTPADIWNLGCIVTELLTGGWLFEPWGEKWSYEEDHLVRMTEALEEEFDPSFLTKCAHRELYFKPDGSFAHFTTGKHEATWTLRKQLMEWSQLGSEQDAAEAFLHRCLRLKPEERATAKELQADPWLAGVQ